MTSVSVRTMTEAEYQVWQRQIAEEFAGEQVAAGRWDADGAVERAMEQNASVLPQGLATPRMLILRGVDEHGSAFGRAWVGLDHPRGVSDTAFLYDIEVESGRRGEGLGRALLVAVEDAVRRAGAAAIELNVFGRNGAAVALYDAAGYIVVTQQMRKELDGG